MIDDRPPQIVGYRYSGFVFSGPPEYRCGADADSASFPTVREPVWRGEVPDLAECSACGIFLKELE